jgi:hypothetical protein
MESIERTLLWECGFIQVVGFQQAADGMAQHGMQLCSWNASWQLDMHMQHALIISCMLQQQAARKFEDSSNLDSFRLFDL